MGEASDRREPPTERPFETALVLSGGGMFGAYQVGVWKVLESAFRPDIVIGLSVGALNGWAIASGCPAGELEEAWLDPALASLTRWRPALWPVPSMFSGEAVAALASRIAGRYELRIPMAAVAMRVPSLEPEIFRDAAITWRHLTASCSFLGGYPPVRLDGRLYGDAGLLGALPLWVAARLGVRKAVAVNLMHRHPSNLVRGAARLLAAGHRPDGQGSSAVQVVSVHHHAALGPVRHSWFWDETRIRAWIRLGEAETQARLREIANML